MARWQSFALRLACDRRGAGLLELGLVLPILAVVLLGLVDVATCYSAQLSLEQAAARSLERVQAAGSTTNFAFVRTEAARAANVPESQVVVDTWLECNNQRQPATVQFCPTAQASARYLQVTINSIYAPYFRYSPLGRRSETGTVAISASSALRTS